MESMSCVAQSLVLMQNLTLIDEQYGSAFSLVSCEEQVLWMADNNNNNNNNETMMIQTKYQLDAKDNVKEHVLVCLKFHLLEGNRYGFVLMDPGYHLSRPIVVMNDTLYPHTGWFQASHNRRVNKEFCYQVINDQYIAWKVRETKIEEPNEVMKQYVNIIYIKKEFIKYANVTEKRACIFSLKSYVIRNRKGAVAGFYSSIDEQNLTIFYEDENGKRISKKFHINDISTEPEVQNCLIKVAAYKNEEESTTNPSTSKESLVKKFNELLLNYRQSLYDEEFCFDLYKIDKWIEED